MNALEIFFDIDILQRSFPMLLRGLENTFLLGITAIVFGTILVIGVVTRLNILAVAVLMLTSNIVFLIEGRNEEAMVELIGHLPIIATALILLVLGSGQRLKVTPRRLNLSSSGAYRNVEGRA